MGKSSDAPIVEKDLKDIKQQKATVVYKLEATSNETENKVTGWRLVDPWRTYWKDGNRLEKDWLRARWLMYRKRDYLWKAQAEPPFKVEEKGVDAGEGEIDITWTVWDDAKKLPNPDVEMYAVMRAEHKFIDEGYTKIASKYVGTRTDDKGEDIPIENLGVDNFFKGSTTTEYPFVFCESKFTRFPDKYDWTKEEEVWKKLGSYKIGSRCRRQMSWQWITSRALAAKEKPQYPRKAGPAQKRAVRREIRELVKATLPQNRWKMGRIVNSWGSKDVPVYPGRYMFVLGEKAMPSRNELHLKWTLDIKENEFRKLGRPFDIWAKKNPGSCRKKKKK